MKLKSVTFRCTEAQLTRLNTAMHTLECHNRTIILSAALEEFLLFAEQAETKEMDLFEMVQYIDTLGSTRRFAAQAK